MQRTLNTVRANKKIKVLRSSSLHNVLKTSSIKSYLSPRLGSSQYGRDKATTEDSC